MTLANDNLADEELLYASKTLENGIQEIILAIPSIHCGGCVNKIEQHLAGIKQIHNARVNLSTKRVTVQWKGEVPPPILQELEALGHPPHIISNQSEPKDNTHSQLVRALAVAGFGASNVMILSVAVWAGVEESTKTLFHWISAFIALPVLLYSGRIFFLSAWQALKHGHSNMDVPISVGILLSYGLSFYDTIYHGEHAYFDAAVMLVFFLLIGRTLDHMMRVKARTAVKNLSALIKRTATLIENNEHRSIPVEEIKPGMRLLVPIGQRIPVDAQVMAGISDIDSSLVTGEAIPHSVMPGSRVQAGILNVSAALEVEATSTSSDSFLADVQRMVEKAEASRTTYRRLADRAAQYYTPLVHGIALASFIGWMMISGDIHHAITIAVAVLIITCPCALGLAVPMVQVIAAKKLHEKAIIMKDGAALERLRDIDTIIFDKTGTLTLGEPVLINIEQIDAHAFAVAAKLSAYSTHPYSRAITKAYKKQLPSLSFENIRENVGAGLETKAVDDIYRLGKKEWALPSAADESEEATVYLTKNKECIAAFQFQDVVRTEAKDLVSQLKQQRFHLEILSGDKKNIVKNIAEAIGIEQFQAEISPQEKVAQLDALKSNGNHVLMIGDGLNDVPALTASHVSMAPANANDIGQQAADFVFLQGGIKAIPYTLAIAAKSHECIRQNFMFAIIYNMLAVPLAVAGLVTPLIAALAMSLSSIVVVVNAMRLPRMVRYG